MKSKKYLYLILAILLLPAVVQSKTRIIHVEWEQQNAENLVGYRLYLENNLACATADPNVTTMDCTVEASDGESLFYLTSYFQDGIESQTSDPYSYIFSENLKAALSVDISEGASPLLVTFDATPSTGNILSYMWLFGDGETGNGSSVSHTFTTAGDYTVQLQVTDDLGATDRETIQVVVTDPSTVNTPPIAVISSSTSVGEAPFQINFDGSESTDSDGTIILYQWDMGDGATYTGPQTTHTYTIAGTYNATLSVTDNGGLIDSISTPVIVSRPPEEENIPPTAIISASTNQGPAPLAITFNAAQSSDQDGSISSYAWDFGDGTTSFDMSTSHIYTLPGSYTISLDVTDNLGASTKTSLTVTVQDSVPELSIPIELGEVMITSTWSRVDFTNQFTHPIVIAGPLSYNDTEPAVVRLRNVDQTGFDIRVQEWDYLDDSHSHETIHYVVMEQGNYVLSDGTKIEAGSFTAKDYSFQTLEFNEAFQEEPVLFTTVSSYNGSDAVAERLRKISTSDFQFRLSEQESKKRSRHNEETIGYIAWEPGSGSFDSLQYEVGITADSVTHNWHQINFQSQLTEMPFFFAEIESYDGGDNSTLRYQYLTPTDVNVFIEEDASKDSETAHTTESVGYMVFERNTD